MKIKTLLICTYLAIGTTSPTYAIIGGATNDQCTESRSCDLGLTCSTLIPTPSNCTNYDTLWYPYDTTSYGVSSCSKCSTGYELVSNTIGIPDCNINVTYYSCKQSCTGCSNCTSDTSWSAAGTGYQKKVTRTCSCNTCSESTSYQCAAGYYGSSTNGTSGCTACGNGATSPAGTTSQSGCYIPSGSAFSDSTGSGSYTGNCYY